MIAKTSIVLPANNEEEGLKKLLPLLIKMYPEILEIIVVNDGSTDETQKVAESFNVKVVKHHYPRGNGASVKSGTRVAKGDFICFMDADGQHKPESVGRLLNRLGEGFDMVVGARERSAQASTLRLLANKFYNWFASVITGYPIKDLTSGLRVVKKNIFQKFIHLLPNGFSYPTTSTMAFLKSGYHIDYLVEDVSSKRLGNSHINIIKDGARFLLIIFKVGTLYSPLKVFTPFSFVMFTIGFSYYLFTYFTSGQLTNMSVILFTTSVIIFLIGLVSEQINILIYMNASNKNE